MLEDACRVVKEFMARDPEEVRFTIVALAATPAGEAEEAEEEQGGKESEKETEA